MQNITPFLWFDTQAEDAMNFYVSLFPNSKTLTVSRYSAEGAKAAGRPEGSVMVAAFELNGKKFMALNGGPMFKFTEAISFMVECDDQTEIDRFWNALTDGGQPGQCGWLKDKFGVSWQIVPTALGIMMGDKDPAKSARVMQAMLAMTKIDLAKLQEAYAAEK
jgi:predicted 3-demethylubiquinone-9 3-methyltransferase (glyoxalase superfamily)